MRGEFRPWTEKALRACFQKLTDPEEMLKSVVKKEMDRFLPGVLSEVIDVPNKPPDYEDVQKNVKKLVGYGEKVAKSWKDMDRFPPSEVDFRPRNPLDYADDQKNVKKLVGYGEKAVNCWKEADRFPPGAWSEGFDAPVNCWKEMNRFPPGAWSEEFDAPSKPQKNIKDFAVQGKKGAKYWTGSDHSSIIVPVLLCCSCITMLFFYI